MAIIMRTHADAVLLRGTEVRAQRPECDSAQKFGECERQIACGKAWSYRHIGRMEHARMKVYRYTVVEYSRLSSAQAAVTPIAGCLRSAGRRVANGRL